MFKKYLIFSTIAIMTTFPTIAQQPTEQDQEYINKLAYRRNRLEIITKKRMVEEKRSYTTTDIDTTTYSIEAFTYTTGRIATEHLTRLEPKEWTEWYILKGGIRALSDLEFLQLVGDQAEYNRVLALYTQKATWRTVGNITIGIGLATMIGGAAMSASQSVIMGGGIATAIGFFISAFNLAPQHYIQPDYAQEKIDEYNLALKRKLNLPLNFE